jgi:hypothetical protein
MKFKLITTGYYYSKFDKEDLEKLGFKFKKAIQRDLSWGDGEYYKTNTNVFVIIKSLKELIKFAKENGQIIVDGHAMQIEIYDNYRE